MESNQISIEEVDLGIRLPCKIKMVQMQPYVYLKDREPFQWLEDKIESQKAAIQRTLEIANNTTKKKQTNGHEKTDFTVFPEYSIPGIEGVQLIDKTINDPTWPNETVVIGGVDGLKKADYTLLCNAESSNYSLSNSPDCIENNRWINCCVTWVKKADGEVEKWIQPKIIPAWPELNTRYEDMFSGSTVYLFKCTYNIPCKYPCNFFSMICFDWIGQIDGRGPLLTTILSELSNKWAGTPRPLHWVFVLQQNQEPNHHTFLNSTNNFLVNHAQFPLVEREHTAVVLANNAASDKPCRSGRGGFSAFVFHPSSHFDIRGVCRPTVCMNPSRLRGNDILARCKDVVFREMGPCIHSFEVYASKFVTPDATQRCFPIMEAKVHALSDNNEDPRTPGDPVPASVKWVNDALDETDILGEEYNGANLALCASEKQHSITKELRQVEAESLEKRLDYATCPVEVNQSGKEKKRKFHDADEWNGPEKKALEHMLHTLTIFDIGWPIAIKDGKIHGTITIEDKPVELVTIKGHSHELCKRHLDELGTKGINDKIILISRDKDNTPIRYREIQKITEPVPAGIDTEVRFTDIEASIIHLDYESLLTFFRIHKTHDKLKECLYGNMASQAKAFL